MKVYEASVVLHIVSAIVWIGGMIFLSLVLVPITRKLPQPGLGPALLSSVGRRFRVIGWIAIALLILTGSTNLYYQGVRWETVTSGRLFSGESGTLLAIKLSLVAALVVLSILHDFILGPRAARALERLANPGRPAPEQLSRVSSLRRWSSWLARLSLLLALAAVALGTMMVRGVP